MTRFMRWQDHGDKIDGSSYGQGTGLEVNTQGHEHLFMADVKLPEVVEVVPLRLGGMALPPMIALGFCGDKRHLPSLMGPLRIYRDLAGPTGPPSLPACYLCALRMLQAALDASGDSTQ